MHPIFFDNAGVPCFKANPVIKEIKDIVTKQGFGIDRIVARYRGDTGAIEQFYQLSGCPLAEYRELADSNVVSGESADAAVAETKSLGYPWGQGPAEVAAWEKANGYPRK